MLAEAVVARKGALSTECSYDDVVDVVPKMDESSRRLSVRFLRLLKGQQPKTKKPEPKPVEHRVQLGSPMGCPEYDRYTYHSFGQLYVQEYVEPGVLRAWCQCGSWTLITTVELDSGKRTACADCHDPAPKLTRAAERMRNHVDDDECP